MTNDLSPERMQSMRCHFASILILWTSLQPVCAQNANTDAQSLNTPGLSTPPAVSVFQKDEVDLAAEKAIAFLLTQQKKDTGAIFDKSHDTTMTSLAIMAMASVGVQPVDPGPEGQAMHRALEFVLGDDRQDDQGYFGQKDGGRMYGHGIVTLMLTEMLGMTGSAELDQRLHDRCQKAVDLILSSQKEKKPVMARGGWRYNPNSNDADLSASVWQLMALRSAKNDGLQVPASAIQDAVEYLKRSYSSPLDRNGQPTDAAGGFCYEPGRRSPTYTMTAAGLLAMQVCGEYDSPLVAGAADWLLAHPPKWTERFCMYGTYYYAQGMYQRGGDHSETARKLVQDMLLQNQSDDGSWEAKNGEERNAGKVYCTSMAVLSLSVKYHYLPIYQK
ncbi:MAG: prenyltransferase/squalene oxidase repeat-containing protein [Planctomycetaceae bacterium]